MSDETNQTKETKENGFTAPYVSWGSFKNLLDRMAKEGLPMRIDRSYLSNMAGSTQSHLLKALRELGLIDENDHPTASLKALIPPESRSERISELVRHYYSDAINLGDNATQAMLEEKFANSYSVAGGTRRKSIAFFLAAAKEGDVAVSNHFKTPKRVSSNGTTKRKSKKQAGTEAPPAPTPTPDDPKRAYVDLLLKKADEEMSPELLDRIERAIGLDPQPSEPSPATPGGSPDS